jgi:uncharacterized protein (DUF58 family)
MTAMSGTIGRRRSRRLDLTLGMPRLTRRGWCVLAAAAISVIVAFSVGWRDLLYVGLVLGALVVASAVAVRARISSLSASRRNSPDVVSVGEQVTAHITVSNKAWLRSSPQMWRDLTPRGFEAPPFQTLPSLAPRGDVAATRRVSYTVEARERGVVALGPLVVERSDPFGLTLHERLVGESEELTVLPRIVALDGSVAGRSSIADAAVPTWKTGHGHDDVIARDYRAGDALRHVNWRATAHRGELMVRQEQSQDEARALVVLDTRRESYTSAAAFEWAVEYTASLLVHLSDTGVGVSLLETVPAPGGLLDVSRTAREALLDLATVERRTVRGTAPSYLPRLAALLSTAPAPIYAVLGSAPDDELRALAPLKARASGASVVLVGDGRRVPPDEVWLSGWRSASASSRDNVAEVWLRTCSPGAR